MSHARQKSGGELISLPDFFEKECKPQHANYLRAAACVFCLQHSLAERAGEKCMSMAKINYIFDTEARSKPRRGWPPKNCCHCREFRAMGVLPTPLLLKYLRTLVPSRCLNFGKKDDRKIYGIDFHSISAI